ncbi:MAG: hypothetical protein V2A76_08430 [Planctomycetota bacterium]
MRSNRWLPYGLAALLAVLVSLNTLSGEFVYDDLTYVQGNPSVLGEKGVFTEPAAPLLETLGLYRPLTVLTYRWNARLGGLEPLPFHLVNVLLHALASLLVVSLAAHCGASRFVAGLAGMLFAAHPVHVEAVAWIVGRAEILATILAILAILAHGRPGDRRPVARAWLGALLFAAAALAKESALCLPAFFLLRDLLSRPAVPARRILLRLLPAVTACLALVLVRFLVLGRFGPDVSADPFLGGLPLGERALLGLAVIGKALRLMVVPQPASVYYLPTSMMTSQAALLGLLFAIPVLALAVFWRRRSRDTGLLGLVLGAVGLLPFLHLIPIGAVFGDRFLYLPSAGFCVALACLLMAGSSGTPGTEGTRGALRLLIAGSILLLFSGLTVRRNPVFAAPIPLWEEAVAYEPDAAIPHYQLAHFYKEVGLLEYEGENRKGAIFHFLESLRLGPGLLHAAAAHLALGEYAAARLRDAAGAAAHHRASLQINPNQVDALLDLAALYPSGVVTRQATEEMLEKAMRLDPDERQREAVRQLRLLFE